MKKTYTILLCHLLVFCFASCKSLSVNNSSSENNTNSFKRPITPRNFNIKPLNDKEILLTWSVPFDNSTKYLIERKSEKDEDFKELIRIAPDKRKYLDKENKSNSFTPNTTYYYRITAISSKGLMSLPTKTKEIKTPPLPPPPFNITATPNKSRGIFLTWDINDSEIDKSYIIQRKLANKPDSFKDIAIVKNMTFYQDGGTKESELSYLTDYIYRIITSNKFGLIGEPSDPIIIKTLQRPKIVHNIIASSNMIRCIQLEWKPNLEPDIEKYDIFRKDDNSSDFVKIATINGRTKTSFLDGKTNPGILLDNHAYEYKIVAVNSLGDIGPDSDICVGKTREVPPIVKNITASYNEFRTVTLSWEESQDSEVCGYYIYRSSDKENFKKVANIIGIDKTKYTDIIESKKIFGGSADNYDGTPYFYKILAYNKALATSAFFNVVKGETRPPPPPPINLKIKKNPKSYTLSWEILPNYDITQCEVWFAKASEDKFKYLATIRMEDTVNYWFTHEETEKFCYKLKTKDKFGLNSEFSEIIPIS